MIRTTSKTFTLLLFVLSIGFLLSSCSDDTTGPGETESQLQVRTAEDIPANPEDGGGGPPGAPTNFTYYSLTEGKVIANSDSATTNWDIAFSGLTILINSGTSGPGQGGAVILDQSFEATTMAPSSGFSVDTDTSKAAANWYDYDMESHVVRPLTGKTMVVRTADGEHYAKLNILNYYKGNPDMSSQEFQNDTPPSRYYTFNYAIQMNGSHDLK